jgi:hypothetical protein
MGMRTTLLFLALFAQGLSVQAKEKCDDPHMRLLTAMTRYCVVTAASQKKDVATCQYDCLISTEFVHKPFGSSCPLTVKQRLYNDGSTEIVLQPMPSSVY